ncbi:unnamed protein product [Penicillium nalgiovense]|nr:unnamed protein product [Penicillium nalgiovense]
MSNSTDPSDYCTLDICPLSEAYIEFLALGIRYRTWSYLAGLFGGLVLEIIGYAGRLQMQYNPFRFDPYLEYISDLPHNSPCIYQASIYICLGRIVVMYGENIARLRPRTYVIIFILCDPVLLLLQASGGAITSIADADQPDLGQAGINIMIAGLLI